MKKIYTFLMVALVSVLGFSAKAADVTVKLDVDNAERVSVSVAGQPVQCTDGVNSFVLDEYKSIIVKASEGNAILSLVNEAGTPQYGYNGSYSIYGYGNDGRTFSVVTAPLSEIRTAKFTIKLNGDPKLVSASLQPLGTELNLVEGEQEVEFSPEYENKLAISAEGYSPLYQVTLDGEVIASSDYECYTDIEDGAVVVIDPDFPDKDCTYTVTYGEGAEDCIEDVATDEGALAFIDNKFVCKAGTEVYLMFNSAYKVDAISIGGKDQDLSYMYGDFSFIAQDDAEIHIEAHKYGNMSFTININKPEGISIYNGYYYEDDLIELESGLNNVTIPESENTMISFVLKDGYYAKSITDQDGNEYKDRQSIYVKEGMDLTFDVDEYVFDQKAVVYIDDITAYDYYFSFMTSSMREIQGLKSGYNVYEYAESFNPFFLSWGNLTQDFGLNLNGEMVKPQYQGMANYRFSMENNSVLKVFLTGVPEIYKVTFDAEDGAKFDVTRDLIVAVTDLAEGFDCYAGTQVSVAGEGITVKVNDDAVEADAEGNFTFTVAADTKVTVSTTSGVADIAVDNESGNDAVYNLQGVNVGTRSQLGNLPAGIYICGGKKVVVK